MTPQCKLAMWHFCVRRKYPLYESSILKIAFVSGKCNWVRQLDIQCVSPVLRTPTHLLPRRPPLAQCQHRCTPSIISQWLCLKSLKILRLPLYWASCSGIEASQPLKVEICQRRLCLKRQPAPMYSAPPGFSCSSAILSLPAGSAA